MGDATWISCQLYLNGELNYSDRADAGDGTDVNCLRMLNWRLPLSHRRSECGTTAAPTRPF
jgi:hypothetical protein